MKYPAFFIPCDRPYKYSEFKQLYNKKEIPFEKYPIIDNEILPDLLKKIKNNPQTIRDKMLQCIIYKRYKQIIGKNIKHPFLPGFMLKRYELDNDNRIKHIFVRLGSYYQNVYTSHILEYAQVKRSKLYKELQEKHFKKL